MSPDCAVEVRKTNGGRVLGVAELQRLSHLHGRIQNTLTYTLYPTPYTLLLDPDRLDIHELAYAEFA